MENIKQTVTITIDGSLITTTDELINSLKVQLTPSLENKSFPELSFKELPRIFEAISFSCVFNILNVEMLSANLGSDWNKLYNIFTEAADGNYNLSISIDEFKKSEGSI